MRFLFGCASLFVCGTLCAQQVSVVNAASFRAGQAVSPGSFATAFGTLTGVQTTDATSLPLPANLGGVSLLIGGVPARLIFVNSQQVNFVVPSAVTPGLHTVSVTTGTATLNGTVRIMSTSPGLFPKDTAQPPRGAVQNQDFTDNAANSPERRGRVIQIYATGQGELQQAIADGVAAPGNPPISTRSVPQVFIGGVEAVVQFSGLAPTLVGIWQINAVVPDLPFIAGRVPLRVFMDGVDSNEVAIFVAQ